MSRRDKNIVLDFGFDPAQSEHHFVVIIPRSAKQDITVYEFPDYDEDKTLEGIQTDFLGPPPKGKVMLNALRWNMIENAFRAEFNGRMRRKGIKAARWKQGINRVHRLFGKELMVLAWAVEDADPGAIPQAVENWMGLKPEERWWLYTVTNAATGHPVRHRNIGWRTALRYALTENPVAEGRYTGDLFEEKKNLFNEEEDLYKNP